MQKCDPKFLSSEVFDNYEFISAVGSGAFGRVLRAKHRCGGADARMQGAVFALLFFAGGREPKVTGWILAESLEET